MSEYLPQGRDAGMETKRAFQGIHDIWDLLDPEIQAFHAIDNIWDIVPPDNGVNAMRSPRKPQAPSSEAIAIGGLEKVRKSWTDIDSLFADIDLPVSA